MKKYQLFSLILVLAVTMSSCELVGDIFKAGVWVGVIAVFAVIALIIFILRKIF